MCEKTKVAAILRRTYSTPDEECLLEDTYKNSLHRRRRNHFISPYIILLSDGELLRKIRFGEFLYVVCLLVFQSHFSLTSLKAFSYQKSAAPFDKMP